jgi:hypothetical protein
MLINLFLYCYTVELLVTACHEHVDKFVLYCYTVELHPQAKGRMKQDPLKRGAKIGATLRAADDNKAGVCRRSMPFVLEGTCGLASQRFYD